jgi:hypothetical protein
MTIAMYHPDLEPPHNTCEAMNEAQVVIYEQSGWVRAPEPAEPEPGLAAQPVQYAPVSSEPAKAKSTRKSASPAEDKE